MSAAHTTVPSRPWRPPTCRQGRNWLCPAHDDRKASLSLSEADDGKVLVRCHAGCTVDEIVAELGLGMRDLFEEPLRGWGSLPPHRACTNARTDARSATTPGRRSSQRTSCVTWGSPTIESVGNRLTGCRNPQMPAIPTLKAPSKPSLREPPSTGI
jgi:hypothetical protein